MARPTKYNAKVQAQADAYVSGGYEAVGDAVPSVVGLAGELGVTRATLRNWADEHEQFLTTLDNCRERQERVALSKGLKNEFNSAIVKLLLANHGYSDRQALEHTGRGGGPIETRTATELTDDELAAFIAAGRN